MVNYNIVRVINQYSQHTTYLLILYIYIYIIILYIMRKILNLVFLSIVYHFGRYIGKVVK